MLANGRLPNAFGQGLSFAEPDVDMNVPGVVRSSGEADLGCRLTYGLGQVFIIPKDSFRSF